MENLENLGRLKRIQTLNRFEKLPEEVIQEILSRLPINSVFESKCVCSQWRNLINNSHFAMMHNNRSIQYQSFSLLSGESSFLFIPDLDTCNKVIEINPTKLPFTSFLSNFSVVRSVNGLVCLENHSHNLIEGYQSIVICNPVTRDWLKLPALPVLPNGLHNFFGFGYCQRTGQYKVVRIGVDEKTGNSSIEIITVGDDCWRSIENSTDFASKVVKNVMKKTRRSIEGFGVFLNGYLHWVMPYKTDMPIRIRAFDVDAENFVMVPFPDSNDSFEDKQVRILLYMGLLFVGVFGRCLMLIDNSETCVQRVWVMKKYGQKESWVLQYIIPTELNHRSLLQPLGVQKNGKVLAYSDLVGAFYSYDTKNRKVVKLEVAGRSMFSGLVLHVPTLVSLKDAIAPSN